MHLGNDTAMRRLLRDGVGIKDIQKKYLSLCYVSPRRDSLQLLILLYLQHNRQWVGLNFGHAASPLPVLLQYSLMANGTSSCSTASCV